MALFRWLYNQPYLLLMVTATCWGGNAIAGKLAVGHISPFLLTSLRWALAVAILLPFSLPHLKQDWEKIKPKLPFLFALGAIGFCVFNNIMYLALNHTTAINVAIVQASMPLMVFLLNFILFGIRTTGLQLFGFLLTLIGVALVATSGSWQQLLQLNFNFGDILMLVAIMTYGIYTVLLKNKPDIHWLSLISVLAISAFSASIPFALYEQVSGTIIWPDITGILVVIYTALFPSIIAQVFWIRGLELIGSNAGGVFVNGVPIVASILAVLILGEDFKLYHAIALGLVIGGVWFAQRHKRSGKPPQLGAA